jgi:hypothetical protein
MPSPVREIYKFVSAKSMAYLMNQKGLIIFIGPYQPQLALLIAKILKTDLAVLV